MHPPYRKELFHKNVKRKAVINNEEHALNMKRAFFHIYLLG